MARGACSVETMSMAFLLGVCGGRYQPGSKTACRVGRGLAGDDFETLIPQLGHAHGDFPDECGLVTTAAMGYWRQVWGVGLHQEPVGRAAAHAIGQCPIAKGHHAAE